MNPFNELIVSETVSGFGRKMASTAASMMKMGHVRRVRLLYKTILRIHRGLPGTIVLVGLMKGLV